jgi:hypothetical protein
LAWSSVEHFSELLNSFTPFTAAYLHAAPNGLSVFLVRAIASYQLNLAVISAELFHLLDRWMCEQVSLCPLFQLSMNSLVVRIPVRQQPVRQRWSGQAFRDDKRIVAERIKEFAQYFWLFRVGCHALHLRL